jgi:hypothetical protein
MVSKKSTPVKKAAPAKKRPSTKPAKKAAKPSAAEEATRAAAVANQAARAAEEAAASIQQILAALEQQLRALPGARPPRSAQVEPDLSAFNMLHVTGYTGTGADLHFILDNGNSVSLDNALKRLVLMRADFRSLDDEQRAALKALLLPLFLYLKDHETLHQAIGILAECWD